MLEVGQIVKSTAGHDKGDLLVVAGFEGKAVLVCDGKSRPLERPKKKNVRHIESVGTAIGMDLMSTNRKLRKTINKIANPGG